MNKDRFETLDPDDWEEMKELAHRMVEDAFQYIQSAGERPVWTPVPEAIDERLKSPAPAGPSAPGDVYEEFLENILPYNLHTNHPRFWAWYMGSGTVMGALAEFLAATLNPNVGGINHVAPRVESQVIAWLSEMIGFPDSASGILTSGASMANFTALTVARNSRAGLDVRHEGVRAASGPLTAYASVEIHSCNQKAIETLGLGSAGLQHVPVNDDYTIDIRALREQVLADRDAGKIPFCVIATAGTINTGAIDDMQAVADFCEEQGLWFHVDGAIGAVAVLADNVRPSLAGMERADSVALDLHKWMHIPFEAGCVIIRDKPAHYASFALVPEYLQREDEGGGLASGKHWPSDYGLQLTRQFRALKVWMSIKEHGMERFGRMIARNVEQAHYLGSLIEQAGELELMAGIGLDIVCFRYNPGRLGENALNALNRELLVRLQSGGVAAPSYTSLHNRYCLRVAISNHRSRFEDFDLLAEEVVRLGRQLA